MSDMTQIRINFAETVEELGRLMSSRTPDVMRRKMVVGKILGELYRNDEGKRKANVKTLRNGLQNIAEFERLAEGFSKTPRYSTVREDLKRWFSDEGKVAKESAAEEKKAEVPRAGLSAQPISSERQQAEPEAERKKKESEDKAKTETADAKFERLTNTTLKNFASLSSKARRLTVRQILIFLSEYPEYVRSVKLQATTKALDDALRSTATGEQLSQIEGEQNTENFANLASDVNKSEDGRYSAGFAALDSWFKSIAERKAQREKTEAELKAQRELASSPQAKSEEKKKEAAARTKLNDDVKQLTNNAPQSDVGNAIIEGLLKLGPNDKRVLYEACGEVKDLSEAQRANILNWRNFLAYIQFDNAVEAKRQLEEYRKGDAYLLLTLCLGSSGNLPLAANSPAFTITTAEVVEILAAAPNPQLFNFALTHILNSRLPINRLEIVFSLEQALSAKRRNYAEYKKLLLSANLGADVEMARSILDEFKKLHSAEDLTKWAVELSSATIAWIKSLSGGNINIFRIVNPELGEMVFGAIDAAEKHKQEQAEQARIAEEKKEQEALAKNCDGVNDSIANPLASFNADQLSIEKLMDLINALNKDKVFQHMQAYLQADRTFSAGLKYWDQSTLIKFVVKLIWTRTIHELITAPAWVRLSEEEQKRFLAQDGLLQKLFPNPIDPAVTNEETLQKSAATIVADVIASFVRQEAVKKKAAEVQAAAEKFKKDTPQAIQDTTQQLAKFKLALPAMNVFRPIYAGNACGIAEQLLGLAGGDLSPENIDEKGLIAPNDIDSGIYRLFLRSLNATMQQLEKSGAAPELITKIFNGFDYAQIVASARAGLNLRLGLENLGGAFDRELTAVWKEAFIDEVDRLTEAEIAAWSKEFSNVMSSREIVIAIGAVVEKWRKQSPEHEYDLAALQRLFRADFDDTRNQLRKAELRAEAEKLGAARLETYYKTLGNLPLPSSLTVEAVSKSLSEAKNAGVVVAAYATEFGWPTPNAADAVPYVAHRLISEMVASLTKDLVPVKDSKEIMQAVLEPRDSKDIAQWGLDSFNANDVISAAVVALSGEPYLVARRTSLSKALTDSMELSGKNVVVRAINSVMQSKLKEQETLIGASPLSDVVARTLPLVNAADWNGINLDKYIQPLARALNLDSAYLLREVYLGTKPQDSRTWVVQKLLLSVRELLQNAIRPFSGDAAKVAAFINALNPPRGATFASTVISVAYANANADDPFAAFSRDLTAKLNAAAVTANNQIDGSRREAADSLEKNIQAAVVACNAAYARYGFGQVLSQDTFISGFGLTKPRDPRYIRYGADLKGDVVSDADRATYLNKKFYLEFLQQATKYLNAKAGSAADRKKIVANWGDGIHLTDEFGTILDKSSSLGGLQSALKLEGPQGFAARLDSCFMITPSSPSLQVYGTREELTKDMSLHSQPSSLGSPSFGPEASVASVAPATTGQVPPHEPFRELSLWEKFKKGWNNIGWKKRWAAIGCMVVGGITILAGLAIMFIPGLQVAGAVLIGAGKYTFTLGVGATVAVAGGVVAGVPLAAMSIGAVVEAGRLPVFVSNVMPPQGPVSAEVPQEAVQKAEGVEQKVGVRRQWLNDLRSHIDRDVESGLRQCFNFADKEDFKQYLGGTAEHKEEGGLIDDVGNHIGSYTDYLPPGEFIYLNDLDKQLIVKSLIQTAIEHLIQRGIEISRDKFGTVICNAISKVNDQRIGQRKEIDRTLFDRFVQDELDSFIRDPNHYRLDDGRGLSIPSRVSAHEEKKTLSPPFGTAPAVLVRELDASSPLPPPAKKDDATRVVERVANITPATIGPKSGLESTRDRAASTGSLRTFSFTPEERKAAELRLAQEDSERKAAALAQAQQQQLASGQQPPSPLNVVVASSVTAQSIDSGSPKSGDESRSRDASTSTPPSGSGTHTPEPREEKVLPVETKHSIIHGDAEGYDLDDVAEQVFPYPPRQRTFVDGWDGIESWWGKLLYVIPGCIPGFFVGAPWWSLWLKHSPAEKRVDAQRAEFVARLEHFDRVTVTDPNFTGSKRIEELQAHLMDSTKTTFDFITDAQKLYRAIAADTASEKEQHRQDVAGLVDFIVNKRGAFAFTARQLEHIHAMFQDCIDMGGSTPSTWPRVEADLGIILEQRIKLPQPEQAVLPADLERLEGDQIKQKVFPNDAVDADEFTKLSLAELWLLSTDRTLAPHLQVTVQSSIAATLGASETEARLRAARNAIPTIHSWNGRLLPSSSGVGALALLQAQRSGERAAAGTRTALQKDQEVVQLILNLLKGIPPQAQVEHFLINKDTVNGLITAIMASRGDSFENVCRFIGTTVVREPLRGVYDQFLNKGDTLEVIYGRVVGGGSSESATAPQSSSSLASGSSSRAFFTGYNLQQSLFKTQLSNLAIASYGDDAKQAVARQKVEQMENIDQMFSADQFGSIRVRGTRAIEEEAKSAAQQATGESKEEDQKARRQLFFDALVGIINADAGAASARDAKAVDVASARVSMMRSILAFDELARSASTRPNAKMADIISSPKVLRKVLGGINDNFSVITSRVPFDANFIPDFRSVSTSDNARKWLNSMLGALRSAYPDIAVIGTILERMRLEKAGRSFREILADDPRLSSVGGGTEEDRQNVSYVLAILIEVFGGVKPVPVADEKACREQCVPVVDSLAKYAAQHRSSISDYVAITVFRLSILLNANPYRSLDDIKNELDRRYGGADNSPLNQKVNQQFIAKLLSDNRAVRVPVSNLTNYDKTQLVLSIIKDYRSRYAAKHNKGMMLDDLYRDISRANGTMSFNGILQRYLSTLTPDEIKYGLYEEGRETAYFMKQVLEPFAHVTMDNRAPQLRESVSTPVLHVTPTISASPLAPSVSAVRVEGEGRPKKEEPLSLADGKEPMSASLLPGAVNVPEPEYTASVGLSAYTLNDQYGIESKEKQALRV